jgi:hypothetical protein
MWIDTKFQIPPAHLASSLISGFRTSLSLCGTARVRTCIRALCSEGPSFNSQPDDRLSCLRIFMVILNPSRQVLRLYLKLGHGRFLQHSFEFLFTDHPTGRRYTVWPTDCVLKYVNHSKWINKYKNANKENQLIILTLQRYYETGSWGEYWDRKDMKWQEVKSFKTCILCQV